MQKAIIIYERKGNSRKHLFGLQGRKETRGTCHWSCREELNSRHHMSVGLTAIAIIGLRVSEHFTESVGRMREKGGMSQEVVW